MRSHRSVLRPARASRLAPDTPPMTAHPTFPPPTPRRGPHSSLPAAGSPRFAAADQMAHRAPPLAARFRQVSPPNAADATRTDAPCPLPPDFQNCVARQHDATYKQREKQRAPQQSVDLMLLNVIHVPAPRNFLAPRVPRSRRAQMPTLSST